MYFFTSPVLGLRVGASVNEYVVEGDALAFECLQYEVVNGPERGLGERRCAQSVLVAHHDKLEVGVLAQEAEGTDGAGHELQLLERVNLFVSGFADDGAVAVDEQYAFHDNGMFWFSCFLCSRVSMLPYT